jgi:hypothetical protein
VTSSTPPTFEVTTKGWLGLFFRLHWITPVLLLCVVGIAWCTVEHRWTAEAWATPLRYDQDALQVMTLAKSYADGEIRPILSKFPNSFGAPFTANWNDFPNIEEAIYAWYGFLAWLFGVFVGSNVAVLSAHLLAAGSFYFVCRRLRYDKVLSALGAALFSLSPYAFVRGLDHLALGYYWHVPLGLLVVWWCVARAPVFSNRRKLLFCLCVSILHGIQNPYYASIYCQFLVGSALYCVVLRRPWPRIFLPVGLAATAVASAIMMDGASLLYRFNNGPNADVLLRRYRDLELFALKPIELFIPLQHREQWLLQWARGVYEKQALFIGEPWSVYLGILAISSLLALLYLSVRAIMLKQPHQVPSFFWYLLWLLFYSMVGGINGFVGLSGFVLLRCTNRYSIVILALLLFFLVQRLTFITRPWPWSRKVLIALCLLALGIWDQTPSVSLQQTAQIRAKISADHQLVSTMESKLPQGAMIFQLPVVAYPETPTIHKMTDYHEFRPYLHSSFLRYSYASDKGRPREQWQTEVEHFAPLGMVKALEGYGFSAILIARNGYADGGASLLGELRSAGRSDVLAESRDFVCLGLLPFTKPLLPAEFDPSWYRLEGEFDQTWRWSKGDARVILYNNESTAEPVRLRFALRSLRARHLEIWMDGQRLYETDLPAMITIPDLQLPITLPLGRSVLTFRTDHSAAQPQNGDPRFLSFCLLNFQVVR